MFYKRGEMKEHLNRKEIIEKITPVIENTAMRYGLIPIEIALEKENDRWFLRIFIYSADHPVTHKDCENITRSLGDYLDELIPFKYYLEISSPGLDRKLKSEREYIIFKGKNVIVKTKETLDGEHKFEAKLLDYQKGQGLKVLKGEKEYTITLENLAGMRLNDIKQEK